MEPTWQLLNCKTNTSYWNAQHKGSLKSAAAGRQYPQVRVCKYGWSLHSKCLFCLQDIVDDDAGKESGTCGKGVRETVKATDDQIARAPVGDYMHRIWTCPRLEIPRKQMTSEQDLRVVKDVDVRGHPAWERALVARPPLPRRRKSEVETFVWHVKPKSMPIKGIIYSDGSARDDPIKELVRCGWAFVVVDEEGQVIAAAYGLPPPWIDDIGGAEIWGLRQAMLVTTPCSPAWVDCLPVLTAVEKGMQVANDPRNPLVRGTCIAVTTAGRRWCGASGVDARSLERS